MVSSPYKGFNGAVTVDIPRGSGTRSIAAELERTGVISTQWAFMAARAMNRRAILQAGQYSFDKPATAREVYDRIARGDVVRFTLSIPEGYNLFDVAAEAGKLGLFTAEEFLKLARDPSIIRDLDPQAPSLEGYLFPDTYLLTHQTTARDLVLLMTRRFREQWKALGSSEDVHRVVTLASLIEEEAATDVDRTKISSVFHNRLKEGMKLDCDPTVVYAALLENRYRGTIYRSDLDREHPYNTYRVAGLPPGPIANPGKKSLDAALHPEETEYLFFVAIPDGSGRHEFSRDLAAHTIAARRYQSAQNGKQESTAKPVPEPEQPERH